MRNVINSGRASGACYSEDVNEVLKTNIFFVITAVAVVVVASVLVVALLYVVRILRDVKRISETVREESEYLSEDIATLRASVREEGVKFKHVIRFIAALFSTRERKGRARRKQTHTSNKEGTHGGEQ